MLILQISYPKEVMIYMNENEFSKMMVFLGACTDTVFTQKQVAAWYTFFEHVPGDLFLKAIQRFCSSSRYKPTIYELSAQIMVLQYPVFLLTAETEWAAVQTAIRKYGQNRVSEALQTLHPFTREIVSTIGGLSYICRSTDQIALQQQFIHTFNIQRKAQLDLLTIHTNALSDQEKHQKDLFLEAYGAEAKDRLPAPG